MSKFDKTLKLLEQVFCAPDEGDDTNDIITLPNGDKRIELDDSEAKILYSKFNIIENNVYSTNSNLKNVLDYETLYKRLPSSADTKCDFTIDPKLKYDNFVGCYVRETRTITIKVNSKQLFEIYIFHELQHVLQHLYNLPFGSSISQCKPSDDAIDIKIVNFYKNKIENKMDFKKPKTADACTLKDFFDLIKEKYIDYKHILGFAVQGTLTLQHLAYYNLSGEIEAYEVEKKLTYNKLQRKLNPPIFKH